MLHWASSICLVENAFMVWDCRQPSGAKVQEILPACLHLVSLRHLCRYPVSLMPCMLHAVQEALPEDPPWWEVFSVDLADMCMVCREIFKLYHLEKAVYVNFSKRMGIMAPNNASPAPAQMTPAISAGQSGGDAAEPASQGPSPMDDADAKVTTRSSCQRLACHEPLSLGSNILLSPHEALSKKPSFRMLELPCKI